MDNTIFPTKDISDEVFAGVYELMENYRGTISNAGFETIKKELGGKAFQKLADEQSFCGGIADKGIDRQRSSWFEGKPMP